MNFYPRHVGDYLRDTVTLSMLEEGAYTRLLDQYYAREAPLPDDKAMIYRLARAMTRPERAAVDAVLAQFFTRSPDGYRQKRCDAEISVQRDRSESARQSAKRRWSERNANAYANAERQQMRTHSEGICDGNALAMLAISQEPNKTLGLSSDSTRPVDNSPSNPSAINAEKQVKNAATPHDWWRSNEGIDAKGREIGMAAKIGETYPDFKNRIFEAISERERQSVA